MTKLNIVIFACIIALTSCNKAPKCSFESPKDKDTYTNADSIVVKINAEDKNGSVAEVSLFIDNNLFETIKFTPYQFTIPSGTLTEGNHTLKVTATDNEGAVGEATINLTINLKIYAIGDMYDVAGVKGQVYKITDGGKHGMIISLDNAMVRWCTDINATNIQNLDDGVANMNKVKSDFDINNFPAFKWCDDKNIDGITGWYLPAINEVIEIHAVRNQLTINYSSTERMVWSSTEVPAETDKAHVKLFNQDSPVLQSTGKLRTVNAIAVKKF